MEVRMEALDLPGQAGALPKDIFVAFRLGDVQKQSRLSTGRAKTFHFPAAAALAAKAGSGGGKQQQPLAGRVEIFRRVGVENVSLEMLSSAGGSTVEIPCADLPEAPTLSLHLELLAGANGLAGEELAAEELEKRAKASKESRRKDRLNSAQRYISEHNLEELLASSLREVVREKPKDPHEFLSSQILGLGLKAGGRTVNSQNQGLKASGKEDLGPATGKVAAGPAGAGNGHRVSGGGPLMKRSRSNSGVRLEPLPVASGGNNPILPQHSAVAAQEQQENPPSAAASAEAAGRAGPGAGAGGAQEARAEEAELATKAKAQAALVAALDLGDDDGRAAEEEEEPGESVRVRAADMLVLSLADGSLAAALENTLRTCVPADEVKVEVTAKEGRAVEEEVKKEAKERETKEEETQAGLSKSFGREEDSSFLPTQTQTQTPTAAKQRAKEALEQIFERSILTAMQRESRSAAQWSGGGGRTAPPGQEKRQGEGEGKGRGGREGGGEGEGEAASLAEENALEVAAGGLGEGAAASSTAPPAREEEKEEAPETAVEKPHAAAGRPGLRRLKSQAALPDGSHARPALSQDEPHAQQGPPEVRTAQGGSSGPSGPSGPSGQGSTADVMQESMDPEITSPTSRKDPSAPHGHSRSSQEAAEKDAERGC